MKNILQILKQIEISNNITIIHAIESGSRAWGFESKDSDYDVRFVYKYNSTEYLKINKPKDNLEFYFDEKFNSIKESKNAYLDIIGFDIYKFFGLVLKSNPNCIDWLNSPMIYKSILDESIKDKINSYLDLKVLQYHFKSIFDTEFSVYTKTKKFKKLFYSIRAEQNLEFISKFQKNPPVNLVDVSKELEDFNIVKDLIKIKKQSDSEQNEFIANESIEKFIERMKNFVNSMEVLKNSRKDSRKFEEFLNQKILYILNLKSFT